MSTGKRRRLQAGSQNGDITSLIEKSSGNGKIVSPKVTHAPNYFVTGKMCVINGGLVLNAAAAGNDSEVLGK